ncbi:MAG: glutaminyl-peptide cyclotransferase [Thermoanaerobaculia bacterium]
MPADRKRWLLVVASVVVLATGLLALRLLTASEEAPASNEPTAATLSDESRVLRLRAEVRSVRPHDPEAFTQGLLWYQGKLYESTGQYGTSSLRRIDPATGQVEQSVKLADDLFAEGLARVGERLIQLTWRAGRAIVYDLPRLEEVGRLEYTGEGWGLCFDGQRLVMSNGTDTLTLRDPESFRETGRLQVTLEGRPVRHLNELESAEGWIYANVWQSEAILRIDPSTGAVRARIDASGLLSPAERARVGILNGIAYEPLSATFLLTGKLWPKLFEVVFVEAN